MHAQPVAAGGCKLQDRESCRPADPALLPCEQLDTHTQPLSPARWGWAGGGEPACRANLARWHPPAGPQRGPRACPAGLPAPAWKSAAASCTASSPARPAPACCAHCRVAVTSGLHCRSAAGKGVAGRRQAHVPEGAGECLVWHPGNFTVAQDALGTGATCLCRLPGRWAGRYVGLGSLHRSC